MRTGGCCSRAALSAFLRRCAPLDVPLLQLLLVSLLLLLLLLLLSLSPSSSLDDKESVSQLSLLLLLLATVLNRTLLLDPWDSRLPGRLRCCCAR
jgi:hypothetical protein